MDGDLKIQYDENGNLLYEREGPPPAPIMTGGHFTNLALQLDEDALEETSASLTSLVADDEHSRSDWEDINADSYKLLGVGPESAPDDADEDGASDTSDHPLLLTALVRFLSKSLAAMLPSDEELVRYAIAQDMNQIEDPEQRRMMMQRAHEAGARTTKFYTHYLREGLDGYEEDTDQILLECGLNGLGIRKVYNDDSRASAPVQLCHVPAHDIIVSYDAKNFRCGRIAHRMHMSTPDLIRMIQSGQYRSVEGLSDGDVPDKSPVIEEIDRITGLSNQYMQGTETHKIYEIHCELFLKSDAHPLGLARPYIVTIHAQSQRILNIQRNWRPNDPDERRIESFVGYLLHPGKSGVYGMGLGQILANITRALRKAQRRALDSAYLQNHPSGFKLSNFKVRDDATKIRSGEFIDVDSPTGDIRASLMMHPFEGPSPGLMTLADKMEANGKQLGGLATQDLDNLMKAGMAAGPAMAAYEESTEFQSAIHRRLYRAQALELQLLHERMREKVGREDVVYGDGNILRAGDLMQVEIKPYMKPGQASRQKAVLEAQAVVDLAGAMPDMINKRQASLEYLRALGKPNIDDLMLPDPADSPPQPADPVTEYSQVLAGQPIAVGLSQNHTAHIDTHASQMRQLQTSMLPVERGEAAMAALAAHIADHMAKDQMVQVAARIGMPVEQLMQVPPEMEAQIAPMIAEAVNQIELERGEMDQEPSKVEIEQVKGENALRLEQMRNIHAERMASMKAKYDQQLQKMRDDAAMDRAVQDDETAIEIANIKDRNTAPTRAGTEAR